MDGLIPGSARYVSTPHIPPELCFSPFAELRIDWMVINTALINTTKPMEKAIYELRACFIIKNVKRSCPSNVAMNPNKKQTMAYWCIKRPNTIYDVKAVRLVKRSIVAPVAEATVG
jgi:hypothetical protein